MKRTQTAAIKRIINHAKMDALQGIFTDEAGRVCACDGDRAIRLTEPVPPEIPTARGLDIGRFFDVPRGIELYTPSINAVKYFINKAKIENKATAIYDFGDDLPHVNAKYLLDMLRIFPDARIYTTRANDAKNKAIFFESSIGDGLLMPLYKR